MGYGELPHDELHQLRRRGEYAENDPKSLLKTQLSTTKKLDCKRERDKTGGSSSVPKQRPLVAVRHTACLAGKEIARQGAQ